jgi:hypothetical protein
LFSFKPLRSSLALRIAFKATGRRASKRMMKSGQAGANGRARFYHPQRAAFELRLAPQALSDEC